MGYFLKGSDNKGRTIKNILDPTESNDFDGAYSSLTGTPTTLAGFGITDGATDTELSTATSNSSNWDTAYGWGDHSLVGYLTTSSNISDLANVTITTPSSGQVLKYNGSAWVNSSDAGGLTMNTAANTGTGSVTFASESLVVSGTTGQINAEAAANYISLSLADDINSITSISFEGATDDAYEVKLTSTDATADRTITLPDTTGYIATFDTDPGSSTITSTVAELNILDGVTATATELNYLDGVTGITLGSANEIAIVGTDGSSLTTTSVLTIDNSNNYIGINQTSPEVTLHMTGEGAQTAQIRMEQYNDTSDAPDIRSRRGRGTAASQSAVQSGDYIFRMNAEYYNGTSNIVGGAFAFDNTNNAARTQFSVAVDTDGTGADPQGTNGQFKIDGNDSGAITFNNAYKFPTADGSANQFLQTNGSGALSFTSDATFDTITVDDGIKEKLQTKSITSTGTFTFQCASGQIFYVSSPAGNWTANFTDLTIASNYATTTTIVIVQGSTAYLPTGIAIGGSSATINWQGGSAPTGTNNGIDVVTFSFLNVGGTYTVLGQLTDF